MESKFLIASLNWLGEIQSLRKNPSISCLRPQNVNFPTLFTGGSAFVSDRNAEKNTLSKKELSVAPLQGFSLSQRPQTNTLAPNLFKSYTFFFKVNVLFKWRLLTSFIIISFWNKKWKKLFFKLSIPIVDYTLFLNALNPVLKICLQILNVHAPQLFSIK